MLPKFLFLFCCIANIVFFHPAESVTVNQSGEACFTSSSLYVANIIKVAFINLNILAPKGVEKASIKMKGKLLQSTSNLLDALRKEKYNIFILDDDEESNDQRTNIALGLPGIPSESEKMKKILKRTSEFSNVEACNINQLPAKKIEERVYSVPTNDWYNNHKDALTADNNNEQFKRTSEFCNGKHSLRQRLCVLQLSFKHVLNAILGVTGTKQGTKIVFLSDAMSLMGYAFDLEKTNAEDKFTVDVTFVHFRGTKENVSLNKKLSAYIDQGAAFTKGFAKCFAGISNNLERHVCQVTSKRKFLKKYTMTC